WCVDPYQHSLFVRRIEPSVTQIALEPEAVALMQEVVLQFAEPEFQAALQHVDEFLAGMRVRPVAACLRGNPEEHGLEHLRAERKQLNINARIGAQRPALIGTGQAPGTVGEVEELKYCGVVSSRKAVERRNRGVGFG